MRHVVYRLASSQPIEQFYLPPNFQTTEQRAAASKARREQGQKYASFLVQIKRITDPVPPAGKGMCPLVFLKPHREAMATIFANSELLDGDCGKPERGLTWTHFEGHWSTLPWGNSTSDLGKALTTAAVKKLRHAAPQEVPERTRGSDGVRAVQVTHQQSNTAPAQDSREIRQLLAFVQGQEHHNLSRRWMQSSRLESLDSSRTGVVTNEEMKILYSSTTSTVQYGMY